LAERFKDKELQNKCTDILINTTKFAWDDRYGGIFYFKDIKGYPVQ
jgi:N-acylglucosamine 2-epimerase